MAGGEKLLVTFLDGKPQREKPYQQEGNASFVKNFDRKGISYHDKNIFFEVEESAIPLGGEAALIEFILQNLKYPPEVKRAGLEGVVLVQCVLTAAGEITEVRLVKGLHPLLNAEAVRLFGESGKQLKWMPGLIEGNPVSSVVVLPISFLK